MALSCRLVPGSETAPPPGCTPMVTWAAPIAAATANAATGYRRRGTTVAASSALTAMAVSRTLTVPAGTWCALNANSTTASRPSACHG